MKEKFYELYDLLVYITTNYSSMPDEFKRKFSEAMCVRSRLFMSHLTDFIDSHEK